MDRYAVLDADNNVVNVSVWDGVTPWQPNAGLSAVKLPPDSEVAIGGVYDPKAKTYEPPAPPPDPPPTDAEILVQVLVDKGVITQEDVDQAKVDANVGDSAGVVDVTL